MGKDTQSKRNEKENGKKAKQGRELERSEQRESSKDLSESESRTFGPSGAGSPFNFMRRFSEQMDSLFKDFGFGSGALERGNPRSELWSPQVEVFNRGNQLIVRADLPGLNKDDVDVSLSEDEIVLKGERREESEENREGYYRSERSYGSFYRAIPLPDGVEIEDASATFNNGVLEISIPTTEVTQRKGKRLEISEGGSERARAKSAGQ